MPEAELIWINGEFVAWDDAKVHVLSHGYVGDARTLYVIGADGVHHSLSDVSHGLRRIAEFPSAPRTLLRSSVSGIPA